MCQLFLKSHSWLSCLIFTKYTIQLNGKCFISYKCCLASSVLTSSFTSKPLVFYNYIIQMLLQVSNQSPYLHKSHIFNTSCPQHCNIKSSLVIQSCDPVQLLQNRQLIQFHIILVNNQTAFPYKVGPFVTILVEDFSQFKFSDRFGPVQPSFEFLHFLRFFSQHHKH